jgi:hypothetical protein
VNLETEVLAGKKVEVVKVVVIGRGVGVETALMSAILEVTLAVKPMTV